MKYFHQRYFDFRLILNWILVTLRHYSVTENASRLDANFVVIKGTTSPAISDNKVAIMTTLGFPGFGGQDPTCGLYIWLTLT